jgi:hypothetical protein
MFIVVDLPDLKRHATQGVNLHLAHLVGLVNVIELYQSWPKKRVRHKPSLAHAFDPVVSHSSFQLNLFRLGAQNPA